MQRGLDEEKILYLSMPVVSLVVLMRQCQFFISVIKVSHMMDRGVPKYGLKRSVSSS